MGQKRDPGPSPVEGGHTKTTIALVLSGMSNARLAQRLDMNEVTAARIKREIELAWQGVCPDTEALRSVLIEMMVDLAAGVEDDTNSLTCASEMESGSGSLTGAYDLTSTLIHDTYCFQLVM